MLFRSVNSVPLSMMMRFGTPKQHTKLLMNLTMAPAGIPRKVCTSGHLVNLSMVMKRKQKPPSARGKGPKMSSPQTAKGRESAMMWSSCAGWWICLVWNWHALQVLTRLVAS